MMEELQKTVQKQSEQIASLKKTRK
jgi:hypothetical protein